MDPAGIQTVADQLAQALRPMLRPMLRDMVREVLREELHPVAQHTVPGGEDFFQRLNTEIMNSLGDIYRELSSFQGSNGHGGKGPEHVAQAGALMDEASHRLDQVIQATEKATFEIIELVERNMHAPDELSRVLATSACDEESRDKVERLCARLSTDLVQIMTCLSFQDLTGQRIKRVIDMLGKVRDMVAELYVSTGILVKAKEKDPDQPLEELKRDAKARVSQSEVDDLLAQLNL